VSVASRFAFILRWTGFFQPVPPSTRFFGPVDLHSVSHTEPHATPFFHPPACFAICVRSTLRVAVDSRELPKEIRFLFLSFLYPFGFDFNPKSYLNPPHQGAIHPRLQKGIIPQSPQPPSPQHPNFLTKHPLGILHFGVYLSLSFISSSHSHLPPFVYRLFSFFGAVLFPPLFRAFPLTSS